MKKKIDRDAGTEDVHDDVVAANPQVLLPLLWAGWSFGWTVLGLTATFSVGGAWLVWGWGFPTVPEQWLALVLAAMGARLGWEGWAVTTQRLLGTFCTRTLWADSAGISIRVPEPRVEPWEVFFSERAHRDLRLPVQEDRLAWEDVRGARLEYRSGVLGTRVADLVVDLADGETRRYDLRNFDAPGPEIFRRLDRVAHGRLSRVQVAGGLATSARPEVEGQGPSRGPEILRLRPFASTPLPTALLALALAGFLPTFYWTAAWGLALPDQVTWVDEHLKAAGPGDVAAAAAGAWFFLALCRWLTGLLANDVRGIEWDSDQLVLIGIERDLASAAAAWLRLERPRRVVIPWRQVDGVEVLASGEGQETYLGVVRRGCPPFRLDISDIPVDRAELFSRLDALRQRARAEPAPEELGSPRPTLIAGESSTVRWRVLGLIGWCVVFSSLWMFVRGYGRSIAAFLESDPLGWETLAIWLGCLWGGVVLGMGGPRLASTGGPRLSWDATGVVFDEPNTSWFPWMTLIGSARRGWVLAWSDLRELEEIQGSDGPEVHIEGLGGPYRVPAWDMGVRPRWLIQALEKARRAEIEVEEPLRLGVAAHDERIRPPREADFGFSRGALTGLGAILLFFGLLFAPLLLRSIDGVGLQMRGNPWIPRAEDVFRDEEGELRWRGPDGRTYYVSEDRKRWSVSKIIPDAELDRLMRKRGL